MCLATSEILEAEQEFFDKVWYVRSVTRSDEEVTELPDDIREGMLSACKSIETATAVVSYGRRSVRATIRRGSTDTSTSSSRLCGGCLATSGTCLIGKRVRLIVH